MTYERIMYLIHWLQWMWYRLRGPAPLRAISILNCPRCGEQIHGYENGTFTAGFYRTEPGSFWQRLIGCTEDVLCDKCMREDPAYKAAYPPDS